MNETIKLRSMRFWSVFTATALGITCSDGLIATTPHSGTTAHGQSQLMAPPAIAPPPSVASPSPVTAPKPTVASPVPSTSSSPANPLRDQALNLTTQAKLALGRGDVAQAKSFIEKANALRVPDSDFASGQTRPWQVAMEIDRAERQRANAPLAALPPLSAANPTQPIPNLAAFNPGSVPQPGLTAPTNAPLTAPATNSVITASATEPVNPNQAQVRNPVGPSVFLPKQDTTQVKPAAAMLQLGEAEPKSGSGEELYRNGLAALSAGNRDEALKLFNAAWKHEREMDALTRAQLKDKLTLLQANRSQSKPSSGEPVTAMQQLSEEQNMARQKMWREVTTEIAEAEKMVVDGSPNAALDRLQMLRQRVSQSSVDGTIRKSNLAMVDRVITNIQAYVEQNRPAIEQEETNRRIEDQMAMEAATRAKIDGEVQSMVDQYNDLMEKGMYAEAEIVAKKVGQLDPNSEITTVLISKATIAKRIQEQQEIKASKNEKTTDAFISVDEASKPFDDRVPYMMPDAKIWDETSKMRSKFGENGFVLTPAEKAIREKLVEPVDVAFDGRQLSQVMQSLSEMTGIPIYVDPLGLAAEGLTSDHRINLNLNGQSVSLKSALNLMLEPINMTYVIKDEVLKITSKNTTNKSRITKAHPVRDLVTPIPNFVTDYNSGLAGALQSAYQANNSMLLVKTSEMNGLRMGGGEMLANASPSASLSPDLKALGQMGGMPGMPGLPGMPGGMMGGGGPPAMGSSSPFMMGNGGNGLGGGGSLANFTELINLIQTTVDSSWEADGGEDTIREFPSNLSLIVSAPLETHEAITDLLKQLRALQNLQVTIEVRFITLNDTFFEQMGVDFDFNIADKKLFDGDGLLRRNEGSTTVGVTGSGAPVPSRLNPTLDIQFQNGSFSASSPPFGAPGVGDASSIGFAILSDLELFFFLQAVQGDSRTNVMQAPKVTMFDGQFASINDFAQRPFVMGLQPVVGDFAVAQQPIIVVLNDGTTLNVQSVVSQDKRYVRMTLAPSFTRIEDADRQFTFTGTRTSRTGTSVIGPDGKPTANRNNEEEVVSGSTVQLPTLGTTSVTTTVNVPDGGTILLGGIKRLQEGRNERGVPILSKIPYINRLFKNVGIGRTTNTLMMTVTPRIIIPEEEEAKVTGTIAP